MSARGLILGICALAVPCIAAGARADSESPDSAIAHGVALRREHKDKEALDEFRLAYEMQATARALAQVALAEAALEQWATAEVDLRQALTTDDPWIEKQKATLRLALDEIGAHLGALEVSGPAGGQLWIDGVFAARLPTTPVRVPARHLVVELRAEGSAPTRVEVDLSPRESARVEFEVGPVPSEPPSPDRPPAPPPKPPAHRTMAWVAAGAGVTLAAAGVALTVFAANRASRYNDDAQCGDLLPTMPRSVRCQSVADQARAAQAGEITAYALAGAATVASAILFLTLPRGSGRHPQARIVPALGGASFSFVF